jgi:hypothetical protein
MDFFIDNLYKILRISCKVKFNKFLIELIFLAIFNWLILTFIFQ